MIFMLGQTPQPTVPPAPATPAPLFLIPTPQQINAFGQTLLVAVIVSFAIYVTLFYGVRLLFRKLEKDVVLVTLNVSQAPLVIILIIVSLKTALQTLPSSEVTIWIGRVLAGLIVAVSSYWIAQLFTQVVAYYLKKYAQRTEAVWDDVLIPILESTIPFLVYAIGAFLFLQAFGIDLTGLWVALGGATFVLGFALQGILSNFFSGLVLLIDTPFQFGDVIALPDGSLAVIKNIGIRTTNLFLIDTHCELFMPNGTLQSQNIVNLSRPAPHYYYSIEMPLRGDTIPTKAMKIIREVALAHPDTLGKIDEKLQLLDLYYSYGNDPEFSEHRTAKKESGRQRLLAERNVNNLLIQIHEAFADLSEKIQYLEKGGLESDETRKIQGYYMDIAKMTGLEVIKERQGKRRLLWLEEASDLENTLIGEVRTWYKAWSKDPDLTEEDPYYLREEWERKIQLLKLRMNKVFQKIAQPSSDETRLDDYVMNIEKWLNERFKNVQDLWQDPKIWSESVSPGLMGDVTTANMKYVVKFFVDNIKLEQCQRGNRVKSEVQAELLRQLRQVYLYR